MTKLIDIRKNKVKVSVKLKVHSVGCCVSCQGVSRQFVRTDVRLVHHIRCSLDIKLKDEPKLAIR